MLADHTPAVQWRPAEQLAPLHTALRRSGPDAGSVVAPGRTRVCTTSAALWRADVGLDGKLRVHTEPGTADRLLHLLGRHSAPAG